MKNFQESIDNLVSKILNEEIDAKVKQIMENKGEWEEELHGGQSKIDVASPKGKITAADFKKLRDAKSHKKEVEEYFLDDDDSEEEEAEELSQNEPTYVGRGLRDNKIMSKLKNALHSYNDEDEEELDIETDWAQLEEDMDFEDEEDMETEYDSDDSDWEEIDLDDETDWSQLEENDMFGSFDDEHGWFDKTDRKHSGEFDFDYDEEEFEDFPSLMSKHGKNQSWFGPNDGETFFNKYKEKFGGKPFRVRTAKKLEEDEATEGNAFSGALAQARKSGKDSFEVDGKEYKVNESEDKWIQKTDMKKGALHKKLGIPEGEKIPKSKLNSIKKDLMVKAKGDKKLSAADSKLLKQVNMALTLGGLKESKNSLNLTESELIDMIEMIVLQEQEKVKDSAEKNTFAVNKPQGLKKTEKAQGESKKENDDYTQDVVKKMKDYMKDMYMGGKGYEANPNDFPQSNYDMEKEHNEMKYHPSDAVEEYIEAFAYPGMTNLVYDEIKPEDKNIEKQIKGDSQNGNAVTGKDGKALGNVSKRSEKVGERFKKNFDENLYGAEQQKASYKRQSQPVDVAGNGKSSGTLKSKQQGADKSSSINKATKILNTLESTEDKATKVIKEDLQKMMGLISYNRKTQ